MMSTNDIYNLLEPNTSENRNAAEKDTTNINSNKFKKLESHIRRLTTNKNSAREIYQRIRSIFDKRSMKTAQQDLQSYLYKKWQHSWSLYL